MRIFSIILTLYIALLPSIACGSKSLKQSNINHIAVIADGNRRWAKQNDLNPIEGHKVGFLNIAPELVNNVFDRGVHTLTLWCFSTENWDREKYEVDYLMTIYDEMLDKLEKIAHARKAKMLHIGRKNFMPEALLKKFVIMEERTKNYKKHEIVIALDYGGRDEIKRAFEKIYSSRQQQTISTDVISNSLDTAVLKYPNPDLVIRTGGRNRNSGFMIWQSEYSEYIYTNYYFPELNDKKIEEAIKEFSRRERSFGK